MRDHARVAGLGGHRHRVECFGDGADLVQLDEQRVADPFLDAARQDLRVGHEHIVADQLDALAGLRPRLLQDLEKLPGARILEGKFTAVQQAVGTAKANTAAAHFLHDFVEEAKASGLVARLIERHHIRGLSVAPPG